VAGTGGAGEVEAALAALGEARQGVYYDEAGDAHGRQSYYEPVDPDADAAELLAALSALLAGSHRRTPEYKPYLHLYPDVDLQADGQLRSIYTGETFVAERLIAEDAETDRRRQDFMAHQPAGVAGDPEALSSLQADLDKALPFNCEHVVPQSWFRRREPMRGDLHHLFTCEMRCNEFRASNAFFDFPDFMESVRTGCGKRDENRFEPNLGKGEVARATLYFLVRYPAQVDPVRSGLDGERLAVLLRWHDRFGVSDFERRRNAAIEGKQGNRNPFIDHPEWAPRVAPALLPGETGVR
jgi:endonuclease I